MGRRQQDDVLERIAQGEVNNDTRGWIETLAVEKTASIQEHALASLVKQGILRREEKRLFQETIEHLWIFRSPRYFSVDGKSQHNVRTRFADVLATNEIPDLRDIALIGLVDACDILRPHFTEEAAKIAPRIEQLRRMDLIGREIARAIMAIDRSVIQPMAHPLAR